MNDTLNDRQKKIMKEILFQMLVQAAKQEGSTPQDIELAETVAHNLSDEYVAAVDDALAVTPEDTLGAATFTIN